MVAHPRKPLIHGLRLAPLSGDNNQTILTKLSSPATLLSARAWQYFICWSACDTEPFELLMQADHLTDDNNRRRLQCFPLNDFR